MVKSIKFTKILKTDKERYKLKILRDVQSTFLFLDHNINIILSSFESNLAENKEKTDFLSSQDLNTASSDIKSIAIPGDRVKMVVELIRPVAIEVGLRFAIREGGRTVGAGMVTKGAVVSLCAYLYKSTLSYITVNPSTKLYLINKVQIK